LVSYPPGAWRLGHRVLKRCQRQLARVRRRCRLGHGSAVVGPDVPGAKRPPSGAFSSGWRYYNSLARQWAHVDRGCGADSGCRRKTICGKSGQAGYRTVSVRQIGEYALLWRSPQRVRLSNGRARLGRAIGLETCLFDGPIRWARSMALRKSEFLFECRRTRGTAQIRAKTHSKDTARF